LLSVELVNLSQQSSWLLDYPLDPAVQQKWSPFAREYAGGAMDCSLIPPSGMCFPSLVRLVLHWDHYLRKHTPNKWLWLWYAWILITKWIDECMLSKAKQLSWECKMVLEAIINSL
jgi:hypothetical protein